MSANLANTILLRLSKPYGILVFKSHRLPIIYKSSLSNHQLSQLNHHYITIIVRNMARVPCIWSRRCRFWRFLGLWFRPALGLPLADCEALAGWNRPGGKSEPGGILRIPLGFSMIYRSSSRDRWGDLQQNQNQVPHPKIEVASGQKWLVGAHFVAYS